MCMKVCEQCGIEKSENFFHRKNAVNGTLNKRCLDCRFPQKEEIPIGHKKCTKCDCVKLSNIEFFNKLKNGKDGLNSICKECTKKEAAKYRAQPEAIRKRKEYGKKYNEKNREKINEKLRKRMDSDPLFRLSTTLRHRTYAALKANDFDKYQHLKEYLGCTVAELRQYLETKFKEGMSWANWGHGLECWHIDHVVPLSSAQTEEELYKLCHYTNLQPLWASENMAKGNKLVKPT